MPRVKTHIEKYQNYLLINAKTRQRKPSEHTIKVYTLAVQDFLRYIKNKEPEKITVDDIQNWKLHISEKYSPNSLGCYFSAINLYMKFLEEKYDNKNFRNKYGEMLKLKRPAKTIPKKQPLTREEVNRLFKITETNLRDNALFKVLYYTMLRVSELINLNLSDIDFDRKILTVVDGKGGYNDEIPLHDDAINSIINYLENGDRCPNMQHEDALFLNYWGKTRIGYAEIYNAIKRYAVKAGITKRIYPHLFRTTSISHLADQGYNIFQIQMLSRHKNLENLKSYVMLSKENRDKVLNGLSFQNPEIKPQTEVTHQKQEEIKPTTDMTEKYIELLKDGLIDKQDFLKLIGVEQVKKNSDITGYL